MNVMVEMLRREGRDAVNDYTLDGVACTYQDWLEAELLAVRHTLMQVQQAYTALENALTRVERLP